MLISHFFSISAENYTNVWSMSFWSNAAGIFFMHTDVMQVTSSECVRYITFKLIMLLDSF